MNKFNLIEDLAALIERDDNYRVLRRIRPPLRLADGVITDGLGKAILLDTETTGTDAFHCEITELAMLPLYYSRDTMAVLGVGEGYQSFQETKEPIPPEITEITGISDADVFGQQINEEYVRTEFAGADLIIAHNAAFDRPIVERHFPSVRQLKSSWACSWCEIPWKKLGAPSTGLESIALGFGYFYDAHRAMNDLYALATILTLTGENGESIFANLWQSANGQLYRVWATGSPFEAKDALKARGYKWRQGNKTWYRDVRTDFDLEKQWLIENRYSTNPRIEHISASERYAHG